MWHGLRIGGRLLAEGTAVRSVLVLAAAILASTAEVTDPQVRLVLIGLLALAMGVQNAIVRRLAVPDLTTTVLTRTITGLVAYAVPWPVRLRRAAGVLALLAGAGVGGALLRWVAVPAPLWAAGTPLTACTAAAFLLSRRPGAAAWR